MGTLVPRVPHPHPSGQPDSPGLPDAPGTGPKPPPSAPPPSGGAITVSAADLKRYAELFAMTGRQVEEVRLKLDTELARLEAQIGDDATGTSFKEHYQPGRTNAIDTIKFLAAFLDGVSEGIKATAQNYIRADEIAGDGVQTFSGS